MKRTQEMFFDEQHARWTVLLNGRPYGLHCGETFELILGNNNILCRLELDNWFVIIQDVRFNLRTQNTYMICI